MSDVTIILAAAIGLDFLLGDPAYRFHPVRLIGALAGSVERGLRRLRLAGYMGGAVLLVAVATFIVALYLGGRWALAGVSDYLAYGLDLFLLYSCIALRDMVVHARPIKLSLEHGDLEGARERLQLIVGRDVSVLDEHGVARASIESVAESFVDGFLAPVFWFAVGAMASGTLGAEALPYATVAALTYRCVNTLDSMVGYRNERYQRMGFAAAKVDDALNFLPARLSLFILWLSAVVLRMNARHGWLIAIRDRLKHASPNSAHTESFVAGALGLKLGGPTHYPHAVVQKPWLGDGAESPSPADIGRTCRLTVSSGVIGGVIAMLVMEVVL